MKRRPAMDPNPDADTDADADPATCPISNCKQTEMCKYFRIKREKESRKNRKGKSIVKGRDGELERERARAQLTFHSFTVVLSIYHSALAASKCSLFFSLLPLSALRYSHFPSPLSLHRFPSLSFIRPIAATFCASFLYLFLNCFPHT